MVAKVLVKISKRSKFYPKNNNKLNKKLFKTKTPNDLALCMYELLFLAYLINRI